MDFNSFVYVIFVAVVTGIGGIIYKMLSDLTQLKIQMACMIERVDNLIKLIDV